MNSATGEESLIINSWFPSVLLWPGKPGADCVAWRKGKEAQEVGLRLELIKYLWDKLAWAKAYTVFSTGWSQGVEDCTMQTRTNSEGCTRFYERMCTEKAKGLQTGRRDGCRMYHGFWWVRTSFCICIGLFSILVKVMHLLQPLCLSFLQGTKGQL